MGKSYTGNYSSVGTRDYLNPSAIITDGKVSLDVEDVKYSTDVEKTGGKSKSPKHLSISMSQLYHLREWVMA